MLQLTGARVDNILLVEDTENSVMKTALVKRWSEKGLAPVLIIIGVAILAGAGFLAVKSDKDFGGLKDKLFPNTLNSGSSCAKDWQDYKNEAFSFAFKIPSGWTDDSIDEQQTKDISFRRLISTTKPQEQVDPKFAISNFEIVASTGDLKYDPDYQNWFKDYPSNSQQSQVALHGLPTEKVVFDVTQPAGSVHIEQYYFKKGEIYYYLHLGIYTTPDLKAKNEAILKCFLENFRILEPEEKKEEIVNGMKAFTSDGLEFKIYYPAALFAHEWQSDYQIDYNRENLIMTIILSSFSKMKILMEIRLLLPALPIPKGKLLKIMPKLIYQPVKKI